MKALIFGGTGMLGHKLVQVLGKRLETWTTIRGDLDGVEMFGIFERGRVVAGIDVLNPDSIRRAIDTTNPDVVINAVGIIKQSMAARDMVQILSLNSIFPHRLAALSAEFGFRLITLGTDCVFDGRKGNYSESDTPDARDTYGLSKLVGEVDGDNLLTIRTSIIGRELATRHSIVEWFLANRGACVNGFLNAIYSGFPTVVLAEIIADLISEHRTLKGVYHIASEPINKFELLRLLNKYYDAGVVIRPFEDFAIDRSLDSSRFRSDTGFIPDAWDAMIERLASDPTPYDLFQSEIK